MGPILVTGGAGFIGSHLVERLLRMGITARVLDDFSTGKTANLEGLDGPLEVVEGDVADLETVRMATTGVTHVVHLAAMTSVPRSLEDPLLTHRSNVTGTFNVLLAAREAGVQRVVYASSSAVYDDLAVPPHHEDMPPKPSSPYGFSKLAGEGYCELFTRLYGLETVSLRYFNVFGPRQDEASPYAAVIPKFIQAILRDQNPVIFGDGYQTRDFIFVEDVVEACRMALTREGLGGQVMNIGCGRQHNLWEVLDLINAVLGKRVKAIQSDPYPGDIRHSFAEKSKAEGLLGFQPGVSLAEGVKRTIAWHVKTVQHARG